MNNLRDRLQRMMMGRYGVDDLSKALLGTAVGVMVINLLLRVRLLNAVVLGLLIYVYFRMFPGTSRRDTRKTRSIWP